MPVRVQPVPFFQLKTLGDGSFLFREPKIIGKVPLYATGFVGYTEFYCQANGDNHNSGTDQNASARYTSVNGNWNGSTTFIPVDGSTPADTIRAGDFAALYLDAGATAASINLITAVAPGVNGTITVSSLQMTGVAPSSGVTGRSIKVGGEWLGPNGASGFPFTLSQYGSHRDLALHTVRTNMKNDQTYSITASMSLGSSRQHVVQGYISSIGDGGKSTWDGGTSTATLFTGLGAAGPVFIDIIFKTTFASGALDLITCSHQSTWIRCVFNGARAAGINSVATVIFIECEAYDCNKSNTAAKGGFVGTGGDMYLRCISHDNTGTNSCGFQSSSGGCFYISCIADSNGGPGFSTNNGSINGITVFEGCDFYNNGGDAININSSNLNTWWIANCNFIKNNGAAVNNPAAATIGNIYNCGYGTGTQANGIGDILGSITKIGCISYPLDTLPWVDAANGDFRLNSAQAISMGRGEFCQTATGYAGAVGYPDIGAVYSRDTGNSVFNSSETWLPDGYVSSVYEFIQYFVSAATVTLVSGTLPTGLTLTQPNATTLSLAGTPTTIGDYNFTYRVTSGASFLDYYTHITILPAATGGGEGTGGVGGG